MLKEKLKLLFKKFFGNIELFLTASAVIVSFIAILINYTGAKEIFQITLLLIIAVDLFAIVLRYLKHHDSQLGKIDEHLVQILNHNAIGVRDSVTVSTEYAKHNWKEIFESVSHDLFISGSTLNRMETAYNEVINLNERKTLRLLSLNIENENIFSSYIDMRHSNSNNTKDKAKELYTSFKNIFTNRFTSIIAKKDNIIEKISNRIIPCTFIAIDCGIDENNKQADSFTPNEKSVIKAYHFIPGFHLTEKTILISASYGTELFNELKNYIETVWRAAEPTETEKLKRSQQS